MSIGRQVIREILDEIETEFFKRLETLQDGNGLKFEAKNQIKLVYQRSVTKAIADYLDRVYVG